MRHGSFVPSGPANRSRRSTGLLSSATFRGPGNIVPEPEKPATKPKVKPKTRAQKLAAALKVCHKKMGKKQAEL